MTTAPGIFFVFFWRGRSERSCWAHHRWTTHRQSQRGHPVWSSAALRRRRPTYKPGFRPCRSRQKLSYMLLHVNFKSLRRGSALAFVAEADRPSTCCAAGAAGAPKRAAAEQPVGQSASLPAGPNVAKASGDTRTGHIHIWCVRSSCSARQPGGSATAATAT